MPRLVFTKTALLALPVPAAGRVTYTDAKTPGLELRITSGGVRTFYVRRRVRGTGRVERVTVGRFPEVSVEAARRIAAGHVAALAEGRSVVAARRSAKARSVTLREVLEDYLTAHDLKPATRREYHDTAHRHLAAWLDRAVVEITRDDVERLHRKLSVRREAVRKDVMGRRRPVAVGGPACANRTSRILRALLNFASAKYEDHEGRPLLTDNPVRRLTATKAWNRVDRRRRRIERDELPAWLAAVDEERQRNPVAADFVEMLIFTGLRRSEAARLRVADVNLRGRRLHRVRRGTPPPPDGKDRIVHLAVRRSRAHQRERCRHHRGGCPWLKNGRRPRASHSTARSRFRATSTTWSRWRGPETLPPPGS